MKRKPVLIITAVLLSVLILSAAIHCTARFVLLSPACYSDNDSLSENENYFIKKIVLEAVENRLSSVSGNGDHLFIWIDTDFMDTVEKNNEGYYVYVQTHFMEADFEDCIYEIQMDNDYSITVFALNP